jgi:hypothetical protein
MRHRPQCVQLERRCSVVMPDLPENADEDEEDEEFDPYGEEDEYE